MQKLSCSQSLRPSRSYSLPETTRKPSPQRKSRTARKYWESGALKTSRKGEFFFSRFLPCRFICELTASKDVLLPLLQFRLFSPRANALPPSCLASPSPSPSLHPYPHSLLISPSCLPTAAPNVIRHYNSGTLNSEQTRSNQTPN